MVHPQSAGNRDLRRKLERLEGLPLRAASARFISDHRADDPDVTHASAGHPLRRRAPTDVDPGWILAVARSTVPFNPLSTLAAHPWWAGISRDAGDALTRLWRHTVAVGLASSRLAREADMPSPDRVGRAGMLHGLGLWAVASIDPEWFAQWSSLRDTSDRRAFERDCLGHEATVVGRKLAERWGLESDVVDATWLHADPRLETGRAGLVSETVRVVQEAFALAAQAPWSPGPENPDWVSPSDPRIKVLIAEVQARCGGAFLDSDATTREEALTRENARLLLKVADLEAGQASRDRLLDTFANSGPGEGPEAWAERAGLAWCGEPGVSAASVGWAGASQFGCTEPKEAEIHAQDRPPALVVPLKAGSTTFANVSLWAPSGQRGEVPDLPVTLPAWRAWAAMIDARVRLEERLDAVLGAFRHRTEGEGPRLRQAKLEALAEFAAGAGHELNNPLAVIVGRAQLLLTRETDPQAQRSLLAILTQAQRAHRILRDLMYVARPPTSRPRFCQPDDVWRTSLRDARAEADDRGVHLSADGLGHGKRVWADPDGLRHLADSLLRNAIEATSPGGGVRVASSGDSTTLRWTIHDHGRGISAIEGSHLFDPFFCGRQAGRGLGMGLSRAARFVELAGGDLQWCSTPGQGATFSVRLPLAEPPKPPHLEPPAPSGVLNSTRADRPAKR